MAAPRFMLRGDVELYNIAQFLALCTFLLSEPRKRFRFLRHLWLEFPLDITAIQHSNIIANFFSQATELESLALIDCDLLLVHPSMLTSFSPMTNLRYLRLHDMSRDGFEVLKRVQAPLPFIHVKFDQEDPADLVPLLSHFRHSLKTIEASGVIMRNADFQYPLVTIVCMSWCETVRLFILADCFPNLRELHFHSKYDEMGRMTDEEEESMESTREDNIESAEDVPWTSLQSVSSAVVTMYMLGLKCRTENLDLSLSPMWGWNDSDKLQIILADLLPMHLTLFVALNIPEFDLSGFGDMLWAARNTLTRLRLTVRVHGPCYSDCSLQLKVLLQSLSNFTLQALRLRLTWVKRGYYDCPSNILAGDVSASDASMVDPFVALDHMMLAQHAAHCLPTLKRFCVDSHCFTITRDQAGAPELQVQIFQRPSQKPRRRAGFF
ncbi:hypothetical protein PsYK624_041190 [Phanerochaete sordida]|uniref:F-box domain-containing protein n=1 Tax=Phanerochaete sordida TaxID=48140 RepID=A0A9P3G4E1_9APHY|nr:hypothetical protein PsYK624_041190 [Phanerochaete sordida]